MFPNRFRMSRGASCSQGSPSRRGCTLPPGEDEPSKPGAQRGPEMSLTEMEQILEEVQQPSCPQAGPGSQCGEGGA